MEFPGATPGNQPRRRRACGDMSFTPTVPISAGHLSGTATFDRSLQSYTARLVLFDGAQEYPPPVVHHGIRVAEFITPDALANHLAARGLELSPGSIGLLGELSRWVSGLEGRAELVGLSAGDGCRHLLIATPSRLLLEINPRIDHPDHQHSWGDSGAATVETARLICEHVWARPPHVDIEAFALTLTHEVLATADVDFSLDAEALCEWFLADAEPGTTLDVRDLIGFRQRLGLDSAPLVFNPVGLD